MEINGGVKGLIDYPKNVSEAVTELGNKLIVKNVKKAEKQVQEIKDNFKGGLKGLIKGELDKAVTCNLELAGNIADLAVSSVKATVGAAVKVLTLPSTLLLIGADKGGEIIADKLENATNNYAKTLSTFFRPVFGKDSSTDLKGYMAKVGCDCSPKYIKM